MYIYTSSSMVPLGYAYGLLRGGILGGSRGGKSTSDGRGVLWVYFKPKRGARYFCFSRFFCKQSSWKLPGFFCTPHPP